MTYMMISLPDGKVLVTHDEPREGFTVPQAVLDGTFTSKEEASAFIGSRSVAQ